MTYIYNKVERFVKWSLWLCLLALLPVQAYGEYGINDEDSWLKRAKDQNPQIDLTATWEGDGSFDHPYLIKDVWDLCRLFYQVNGGYEGNPSGNHFNKKHFRLENDINLGGRYWYPIGVKETAYFGGFFNGNNHTIEGMTIKVGDYSDDNASFAYGLFGYMKGVVYNLKITDAYISISQNAENNAATNLQAGLLCGYVGYDVSDADKKLYGAIFGCDIEGKIYGRVNNSQNDFSQVCFGGMVGRMNIPSSIYQSHAKVTFDINNGGYFGGIVGYTYTSMSTLDFGNDPGDSRNYFPNKFWHKISYLFDCTADVTMELNNQKAVKCGGICGANMACNLIACASSGTIECKDYGEVESEVGGIAGYNNQNIINCVSLATITNKHIVGGVVGSNNKCERNYYSHPSSIVNCVFSGHIDCGESINAHGIVGNNQSSNAKPVNCLFLGTISKRTKLTEIAIFAPLWDYGISTEGCGSYCDVNLYDDEGERPEYLSFSKLTSGGNVGFINSTTIHIDWKYIFQSDINPSTPTDKYFEYNPANDWVFEAGFYPRLQMTKNNLTYCNGDLWQNHDKDYAYSNDNDYLIHMYDFVIDNAFYECILDKDGTVEDALHTPKLFPAYAWLASVPAFTHNGQLAYSLDTSISLANKTQRMDQNTQNVAHYSLSENQTVMDVSGSTATPKVNAKGDVMLTITSADNISKQLLLNVNNSRTWDEKVAVFYDRGDGTAASPYEIHNARQLILAFLSNNKDEHYKLVNDIWFNENLLTNTGEPKEGCSKWDHLSKRDTNHWKAHLDGDGHLVHGLYSTNAFGLVETMEVGASIENTGFVDCLVWSPETEDTDDGSSNRPLAFLSPSIETGVLIRNCLFDGVLYERRLIGSGHMGGLLHTAKNQSKPYVEDCVVAFSSRVKDNQYHPSHSLFASIPDFANMPNFAQRVLVLNNNLSFMDFVPTSDDIGYTDCYFPHGYLKTSSGDSYNYTRCPKTVDEMTDGKFFTGEGFDKWTAKEGRFPMLTTFAGTAYGKLISLPVYTDKDNRFDNMNYLMDFTPNVAKWTTTNENVIGIDTDIRVLEPKAENSDVYLVRSMEDAKIITPIKTAAEITKGIKFEDEEAKKFCLAYYDSNNDGAISLQELKAVELETFEANMNKDDNDPNDNDGDLISAFPEFRYFAGISDLGTSFQDKEKLRTLDFSNKITELSDDDFKGNTSMESFTIPVSVGTVSGQAFYNSGLENYYVETDHQKFTATDGVLYDMSQETLLSYPNGRKNTSIEITDNVKTIGSKAVYKMAEVDTVIINAADYDYKTVVKLEENAITAADGKQLLFLIEDGTQELSVDELEARAYSSRRAGAVDHRGKGALLSKYQESDFWIGKNLESFIYLDISDKSKDSEGNYWATLYCGFDTELPDYMTPYIVDKEKTSEKSETLVLRRISNQVRMLTPVVIKSTKPVTKHILTPSKSSTVFTSIPMYENLLDGIDRNGMQVYQSDANDGGCLTLGRNSKGEIGFFIYKGKDKIPPYRAYISVNKVAYARELTFTIGDDYSTDIRIVQRKAAEDDAYYNLNGQRTEHPDKGIYIYKGKKVIK